MKTIIYYRKSTDRDDKQANSLEHQLENCRRVAKNYSLEIVKEIGESRSAKTEGTRPGFNELISLCKTGKIDYIIIDEPKRLSRNNIDTSRIIDLMDKKYISGVLATSREYRSENSRDKFLLQLDLSLSKMDNEDRAKDVKDKMMTCVTNTGRFLGKAPFGYKNITIRKGRKEIVIDESNAKVVREIYRLRIENKAYTTIVEILREKYGDKLSLNYEANRIHQLVRKKFYYGVFIWNGKEIIASHTPIISKETYDRANGIGRGVYQKIDSNTQQKSAYRKYPLKGIVRDVSGIYLAGYQNSGITYYGAQSRSKEKVSINETKLFDKIGEYIKENEGSHELLTSIDKDIIMDILLSHQKNKQEDFSYIDLEINKLKQRQDKLLDMKLDSEISQDIYLEKNNKIEDEIKTLLDQKKSFKNDDFGEKTQIMLELAGSFYRSYSRLDISGKADIVRKLMLELFIDNKKELRVEESPLFQSSKMLRIVFGSLTEIRTPVLALRRQCPNP